MEASSDLSGAPREILEVAQIELLEELGNS